MNNRTVVDNKNAAIITVIVIVIVIVRTVSDRGTGSVLRLKLHWFDLSWICCRLVVRQSYDSFSHQIHNTLPSCTKNPQQIEPTEFGPITEARWPSLQPEWFNPLMHKIAKMVT